jgi:hypothetical protein
MRVAWEEMANRALAAAGVDARIDRRSLVEQGITDRPASWHRGPGATALERRGVRTEIEERWQDQVAHVARATSCGRGRAGAAARRDSGGRGRDHRGTARRSSGETTDGSGVGDETA